MYHPHAPMFEQGSHRARDFRSILWTKIVISCFRPRDRSAVTRLRVHGLCHGRHAPALHHPYDHCYHARGSLKCDRRELHESYVTFYYKPLTTPLSSPRTATFSSSETSTGAKSTTLSTTATPETAISTLSTTSPASLSEALFLDWQATICRGRCYLCRIRILWRVRRGWRLRCTELSL